MHSFTDKFLQNFSYPTHIVKLLSRIAELKGRQTLYSVQKPEKLAALKKRASHQLEKLKNESVIQSIESSNRIEGVTAPKKRIKALVEDKNEKPRDRSEGEIAGYRDVLEAVHTSAEGIGFTPNIVLQFHRDLMKYAEGEAGRWKITENIIQEKQIDGPPLVRFVPTPPHLTPDAMRDLHIGYNQAVKEEKHSAPILIGLYVLDFLCIHPFLDGNGRMARLLALLALYHQGYEVGRYVSLEKLIESTSENYYKTLRKSSIGWHEGEHNALPWLEYWLEILLASYEMIENDMQMLNTGHGAKSGIVIAAVELQDKDFSIADLEKACPSVSRESIRKSVYLLKDEGKLESIGRGRSAKWRKTE